MSNRFQIELDKIQVSCQQCTTDNCQQCSLNFRKMEFQAALKAHEAFEMHKKQAWARVKREQPLKGHARFV